MGQSQPLKLFIIFCSACRQEPSLSPARFTPIVDRIRCSVPQPNIKQSAGPCGFTETKPQTKEHAVAAYTVVVSVKLALLTIGAEAVFDSVACLWIPLS